ncbi:MAG: sensor domain-containing diguanylate cyclase, partial [Acidobacteria bacterium]|nr:sensor domain-containing diguanylate cyclase [Acidobacteriota bacterium]
MPLGLAVILLSIETFGRKERFLESLVAILVPLALWSHQPLVLSQMLTRLSLIFACTLLTFEALRFTRQRTKTSMQTVWADTAASVFLLAFAALIVTGMELSVPLLEVLGLAAPATIPAAMREILAIRSANLRLKNFADLSEWSTFFRDERSTPSVTSMTRDLHQVVQPILGHSLTVIGINPAIRFTDESFAAFPAQTPHDHQRIGERLQYLFRSGRCASIPDIPATSSGETRFVTPGVRHEIIVPIRRGERSLALVAFVGDSICLSDHEIASFSRSVRTIMLHVLMTIEEQRDLALLSHRSEQEGQRLRSLLKLNELIAESTDLRTLTNNLVRTVCVSFGFSWTGFLLAPHDQSDLKLVAWSGEDDTWNTRDGGRLEISSKELETALSLGSTISRFHVVPLPRWPLALPHPPNVTHMLATPVTHGSRAVGYILVLPSSLAPIPDLKDLRALEILVEQVGPVVASGLHLEKVSRRTLQDALTGIGNRRSLDQFFQRAFTQAKKTETYLSFAMLDIDDFKHVNDRHGHQVGDVVLAEIAQVLQKNVRTKDFVARYGGEEFSIVLPGLSAEHALDVLERLRIFLATTPFAGEKLPHPLSLTLSIGVATYPGDG